MKIPGRNVILLVLLFFVFQVVFLFVTRPILIDLYLHSESHFDPMPEIDTIFAPQFSKEAFGMVSPGMNPEDVKTLLGMPIGFDQGIKWSQIDPTTYISSGAGSDNAYCWHYSKDGNLGDKADFSWYMYRVCFDNDQVYTTLVQEFFD